MTTISGTSQDDTLIGTAFADQILGLAGNDFLDGKGGADRLEGGLGNDSLSAGFGNDTVFGGAGNDLLSGGAGVDLLDGGDGYDFAVYVGGSVGVVVSLFTGLGSLGDALGDVLVGIEGITGTLWRDTLTGNDVANVIYGSGGADEIRGLGGDDFLSAEIGNYLTTDLALLYGGDGNDTLWGSAMQSAELFIWNPAEAYGGVGNDLIYNCTLVYGGLGDDYVYAGNIPSLIFGGAGEDAVEATYGNHTVHGGAGGDFVWTEGLHGGSQQVHLGLGNDTAGLYADTQAAQEFDGGDGIDTFVYGALGSLGTPTPKVTLDVLNPGAQNTLHIGNVSMRDFERFDLQFFNNLNDVVLLGNFADRVRCDYGADSISGRGGADFLDGGSGKDTIYGGAGNDALIAGTSQSGTQDILFGGAGDDVIWGSYLFADYAGVARMRGGLGADVFAFNPVGTYTPDVITDFVPGVDRIALYFSHYAFVDAGAHDFVSLDPTVVHEGSPVLQFKIWARATESGAEVHQFELRYDYVSGNLDYRDLSVGDGLFDQICRLTGAPHLTLADFWQVAELV